MGSTPIGGAITMNLGALITIIVSVAAVFCGVSFAVFKYYQKLDRVMPQSLKHINNLYFLEFILVVIVILGFIFAPAWGIRLFSVCFILYGYSFVRFPAKWSAWYKLVISKQDINIDEVFYQKKGTTGKRIDSTLFQGFGYVALLLGFVFFLISFKV